MIKLSAFSDEAGSELSCQIAALKRNNISLTELRFVGEKSVKDLTLDEAREVSRVLRENGISLSALGSPMGKVNIDVDFEEYIKEVKHMCELAVILGTDRIRMFSFYEAYEEKEKVFEYLREMVKVAESFGVKLYHENEKSIYGDIAERILEIKENVDGLKYIYDFANFLQVGELPENNMDALYPITDYFHIKDVVYETGELVPAGYGDGKIEKIIQKLDRDTVFTIEPHLMIFDAYAQIDGEEMKHRFHFTDANEAFDMAVESIKKLILANGYVEVDGGFEKASAL